jgi:hypothetical protein
MFILSQIKRLSSENRKYENVFKTISVRTDVDCKNLSKMCFQKCIYEKDKKMMILKKKIDSSDVLEWESVVYLYLLDKHITPMVTIKKNSIEYDIKDKISIYEYFQFQSKKSFDKVLLNELFGFVSKFRDYDYLHGNLHIHNIFFNKETLKYYVIDFSNSFLIDKTEITNPKYQRTSYLGEMDMKIRSVFFEYWDFFTLYVSLKKVIKNHKDYLETLVRYYIKQDVLLRFEKEYEKYNDTNILVYHLDNPTIVGISITD